MRVVSALLAGLVVGVTTPAFAKGPAWHARVLEEPTAFGNVELARGGAGVFRSGAPGYGTLAKPLFVSPDVTLPAGSIASFQDAERPPYRVETAAVPGPFSVCGVSFGPRSSLEPPFLRGDVSIPANASEVAFPYEAPVERSEHPDSVTSSGRLKNPIIASGIALPAGSGLTLRCEHATPTFIAWTGAFERDTDVGGVMLRAHEWTDVAFALLGPHATTGVLAQAYTARGRSFPAGTRIMQFDVGLSALCPDGKVSAFVTGAWRGTGCGTEVSSDDAPSSILAGTPTASIRRGTPRRETGWLALVAWGVFATTGLAAFAIIRAFQVSGSVR